MRSYKIQVKSNKLLDKDFLYEQILNLEDGQYNVFIEKAEIGQAKYFFYRDVIAEYLGYGTKKEKEQLHDYIKSELLRDIFNDPDNLNTEDFSELTLSTKFLSPAGWHKLNKSLELFAMSKFDVKLI